MRTLRLLAAAATLVAGAGVAAYAESPRVHVLRVALPDGSVRQIRYTGDVAPRIVLVASPGAAMTAPFAGLDRLAAMMDAQATAMMRQVSMLAARPIAADAAMQVAALARQPAGVRSVTVSSTIINGRTCTTRVQATALGEGKAPQLLRQVSGDGCTHAVRGPSAPIPAAAATPTAPATAKAPGRDTI